MKTLRGAVGVIGMLLLAVESFAEEPLKIGFIGSFSGQAAAYGESARNGFELALEEVGRDRVRVVYEDDGFSPAKTVAAFHKLTSLDRVHLIVTIGSSPSSAVAPLAQSEKMPLVAWASDARVSAGRPYVLRSYPSGEAEGRAAATEAMRLNFGSIGLVASPNDYVQSWTLGVKETLGQTLIYADETATKDTDFVPLIFKARKEGASNFALCLSPGLTGLFARRLRESLPDAKIFGCEYLHDSAEATSAQGALSDAFYSTVTVTDEFAARYRGKFGNENILSAAANHYDLAQALHALPGNVRGQKLMAELCSGKLRVGAVGEYRILDTGNDRYFDIPLKINRVPRPS